MRPRHHADGDDRDRNVEQRSDRERPDHGERNVAFGTFRFFRGDGHRVETDVGEEDECRAADDTVKTVRKGRREVPRRERMHEPRDEDDDREDLHDHERRIDGRRFFDADRDERGDCEHDEKREEIDLRMREIDAAAHDREMCDPRPRGKHDPIILQERLDVARPR